ncbi:MAG: MBL fold metallo-hydrolase [Clostridia bacterium]|nr:MBL fold metallo-hydrolase [Clostridia bacterium]
MARNTLVRLFSLLLCVLLCACACFPCEDGADALRIHFLDVGQGDAILIRTEEGDVLIDSGTEESQSTLCMRLEEIGVKEIALAIFTHPDGDHIGGADGVLERFFTKTVWLPPSDEENEGLELLFRVAQSRGTDVQTVTAGERVIFGETVLWVMSPAVTANVASNDQSIVLRLTHGEAVAMFSGDAGVKVEQWLVKTYSSSQLDCSLYKVGHHGSSTSTSPVFLQAMTPQWAVISCGADNSYGHPHGEVVLRLEAAGATVLRTDLFGEIVFECDGKEFIRIEK